MVGLAYFAGRMPGELSGGQRHRVALARALATKPDVILLDEPFSALDASLRGEVRAQVRHVLRLSRTTAVLVTHDQDEALSMADTVAVLDEGRVVQVGTPAEIYENPVSSWLAQFVGGAVVVQGTWTGEAVKCALGTVPAALGTGVVARKGEAVELVVRPEQLVIEPRARASAGGTTGMVRHVAYFGHDAVVTLDVPGLEQPIEVRVLGRHVFEPDTEVNVRAAQPGIAFARGVA